DMVFTLARPRSHYRTGRNAHLLRDSAPARPTGAPDLSKLARATEDALTEAGVWKDDAAVVEYRRLAKVYPGSDPDALDQPGVLIRIHLLETTPGLTYSPPLKTTGTPKLPVEATTPTCGLAGKARASTPARPAN